MITASDDFSTSRDGAPPGRTPAAAGKILVIDDDRFVRRYLKLVLEQAGYEVAEVADPEEALGMAAETDLFLVDVVLPTIRWEELVARLQHSCHDPRVILMSGYSHDYLAEKGVIREDSGIDFMHKPIMKEELLRKVGTVLSQ